METIQISLQEYEQITKRKSTKGPRAKKGKVSTKYVQILEKDGYKLITYDSRTQDKDMCKRAKKACTLKAKFIRQYYSKNW
jgi:hypothetical protein